MKQILNAGKKKKPQDNIKSVIDSLLSFNEEEIKDAIDDGLSEDQKKIGINLLSSLLQIPKAEMF